MDRWRGHPWGAVSEAFPGELEAYLEHPDKLGFADEPLEDLAERVASVARRLDESHPHGDVVVVSHQDSIQAARLKLIGSDLSTLHENKPGNGAVVTLRPGSTWSEETVWEPSESPRFGEKSDLRLVAPGEGPNRPTSA
jgi:broad specificity phosphatase PhoE